MSAGPVTAAKRPLAILACGALAREVREVIARRGWDADVHTTPALDHLDPKRIPPAVDETLTRLAPSYERVVVVYGDCGTGGELDRVLERHGARRTPGPHCYDMLGGPAAEVPTGTYVVTDWLVRNFDRAVVRGLGLERWPHLKDTYYGAFTGLVWLRQERDPRLHAKAGEVAEYLGLPLEVRDVGTEELERRLIDVVEG